MTSPRDPGYRPVPPQPTAIPRPMPPRPTVAAVARAPRARPDAGPLRLMFGLAGIASVSALTAAMLPSVAPAPIADTQTVLTADVAAVAPAPTVLNVKRYVTLKPGETAPPQSTVVVRPQPTPIIKTKVVTVTRTRQSGKP